MSSAPVPFARVPLAAVLPEPQLAELDRTWRPPTGAIGWFRRVDHKSIGRRYVVTAFVFFALGGLLAGLMRLQLARANAGVMGPDLYDQVFTMHGTTMMFLFAVPVMEAMGLYVIPMMIGTRNVAFPRLNAFGYYVYLLGGLFLYVNFLLNTAPDTGWFAYVPLSGPDYSPGKRVDVWAQLVNFTELAALVGAVELVATILKMRAPGMSLNRMPLFAWAMLVTAFMVIFAMPAVMTGSLYLALDRLVGTQFFNPAEGGDAILWQHLFWFFGHPEVYIIVVPALGMVSTIVSTFCGRPVFWRTAMILSLASTAFIGFGVWVHHMLALPIPELSQSFFSAASLMIAIPTALQIFCWIATMWAGRPRFTVPFVFVLGFIVIFVLGGLTGVMLGSVPLDLQAHDTFFVVAHFHYVLIGGAVFPLFGALYYWFPKFTGRMLDERLGWWHFALMFLGFNATFFPMHELGIRGMTRRVYTYTPDRGLDFLNTVASLGAVLMVMAVAIFFVNVLRSRRWGRPAGDNPWNASTLEWALPSPPPPYNFAVPPAVADRDPLWHPAGIPHIVIGLSTECPQVLVTHVLDGSPDHRYELPTPTIWPFLAAVSLSGMFVGLLFTPWALVVGGIITTATLVAWFWPKRSGQTTPAPALEGVVA